MIKKILIYNSGGGLGDSIQIFPIILSLQNHFKESKIFYLCAHENHFANSLKEFNINIINFEINMKYFGFRLWHYFFVKKYFLKKNFNKFDLIIDLQSKIRNTLILKKIPHNLFFSSTFNFKFSTIKKNYVNNNLLENLCYFLNQKIKRIEYNINFLDKELLSKAKEILPDDNYIGFSITQGNKYRKKSWELDKFISLAKELIKKNKKPVFFLKDNQSLIDEIKFKIPESIFPELMINNSFPAMVTAFASRLEKAISIDNGIMHMMSLAKIPMIILFGPTNSKKFAPKYSGIKVLDSKKMYKSQDINLITVSDVLKEI